MAEIRHYSPEAGRYMIEHGQGPIVGQTPEMLQLYGFINRLVDMPTNVLITGETGTGKGLVAAALHYNNRNGRGAKPFFTVNCPGIAEGVLESQLFGHAKGSFTGAIKDYKGYFQAAEGGTILLDEIGEMSPHLQAKLLQVIQQRVVFPVGSNTPVPVNVRILAATNRNLEDEMSKGTFRQDLFYRLNAFPLELHPLRARIDDVPLIARYIIERYAQDHGIEVTGISPAAQEKLKLYDWGGNVRDLENVVERAIILRGAGEIQAEDINYDWTSLSQTTETTERRQERTIYDILKETERSCILTALANTKGNKNMAAKRLGISKKSLYDRINRLGLGKKKIVKNSPSDNLADNVSSEGNGSGTLAKVWTFTEITSTYDIPLGSFTGFMQRIGVRKVEKGRYEMDPEKEKTILETYGRRTHLLR